MGKKSRNKGYRGEHNLVLELRKKGFSVFRVPLSGATEFLKNDLVIEGFKAEVKIRRSGFRQLYKWIENADFLFVKEDYKTYLVIMRLETFENLLKARR
jgi:Holliday junction resolvase